MANSNIIVYLHLSAQRPNCRLQASGGDHRRRDDERRRLRVPVRPEGGVRQLQGVLRHAPPHVGLFPEKFLPGTHG